MSEQPHINLLQKAIIQIIDAFYFLFKRFMPIKTFRYAACGGGNLVLDTFLYFIFYNFILQQKDVDLGFLTLSSHIASLFFVFPITFLTGFLLNRYITFQSYDLPAKVQLYRYFIVCMGSICISYFLMKLFVDLMGIYPTPSKILTIAISVVYSYLLQNRYTFGKK